MTDEILVVILVISLIFYFQIDILIDAVLLLVLFIITSFAVYIFLPQFRQPATGSEGMVGMRATTLDPLNPSGKVKVRGEIWSATSLNGVIEKDEEVIVVKVSSLQLFVRKNHR
jgi:membrane-bound ClpP family serine protease